MKEYTDVLITGGSGKLGSKLIELLPGALHPNREAFNIENYDQISDYLAKNSVIKTIIHCAAMVSPPRVKEAPHAALKTNIIGTSNLCIESYNRNLRLIYISTDYVFQGDCGMYSEKDPLMPVNKYGWSKLGGECALRMLDKFVIIRLSFGPDIFPYDAAFTDQYTTREPVSIVAEKIVKILESDYNGVVHIGGSRKTVFEYARQLGANVKPMSIREMNVSMPSDTSLDCSFFDKLITNK